MHDFKKLQIWERSVKLVTDVYTLTNEFPNDQKFGLTNQIQRSAVSVPSNIAEGAGRKGKKEFVQFLSISMGSLCELETQLIIANNLNYMSIDQLNVLITEINEIQKMIRVFMNTLTSKD